MQQSLLGSASDKDIETIASRHRTASWTIGNMDKLIQQTRTVGAFTLWRQHSTLIERTSAVNLVLEIFKQFLDEIRETPEKAMYLIYSLEQRFAEAPSEAQDIMYMFSVVVEDRFQPVPSQHVMSDLSKDLFDLVNTTYGRLGKTFRDWARAKRQATNPVYQDLRECMEEEEDGFIKELQLRLVDLINKYKDYVALAWFLNGLLRASNDRMYAFLGIAEIENLEKRHSEKAMLGWSSVGWLSYQFMLYDTMEAKHFVYGKTSGLFQEFMTRTTPGFVFKLTEFQGVLQMQDKKVTDYQSKFLAAAITGGISFMQILMKMLSDQEARYHFSTFANGTLIPSP